MDGLLIFDQQNDIVFTKLNDKMKEKLFEMAKQQDLVGNEAVNVQYVFHYFFLYLT